jgi:hypothetical protein
MDSQRSDSSPCTGQRSEPIIQGWASNNGPGPVIPLAVSSSSLPRRSSSCHSIGPVVPTSGAILMCTPTLPSVSYSSSHSVYMSGKGDLMELLRTSSLLTVPISGSRHWPLPSKDGSTILPSMPSHPRSFSTSASKTIHGTLLFDSCHTSCPPCVPL